MVKELKMAGYVLLKTLVSLFFFPFSSLFLFKMFATLLT